MDPSDVPAFDVTACRFEYVTDAEFIANGYNGARGFAGCEPEAQIANPGVNPVGGTLLEVSQPAPDGPP